MIGRVALLVTFKKVKPKPQSLSRSHIRDLWLIFQHEKDSTVLPDSFSRLRTKI